VNASELKNIAYSELEVIKHEFKELRKLYSELKSCCNANAESVANQNIEKHMERILFSYFPSEISKEDLIKNMQSLLASHNREGSKIYLKASIFKPIWMLHYIYELISKIYYRRYFYRSKDP